MRDGAGEVWNVQLINGSGAEWYLEGRKHGLWHMLGQAVDGKPFGIVEGLATAQTVREATGLPVAVAFDSGNLLLVAQALRALNPASPVTVFDDDDRLMPLRSPALPNVGREKAVEAARAVGGKPCSRALRAGHGRNRLQRPRACSRHRGGALCTGIGTRIASGGVRGICLKVLIMACAEGLEPSTCGFGDRRSGCCAIRTARRGREATAFPTRSFHVG